MRLPACPARRLAPAEAQWATRATRVREALGAPHNTCSDRMEPVFSGCSARKQMPSAETSRA